MSVKLKSLIEESFALYSLPQIYSLINEAVSNPKISFYDIAEIINRDVGLSARLLKIVNSSFYSFSEKVKTIHHAVSIVGSGQLRDLALTTCVLKIFKGIPRDLISMDSFWRHSVACGLAARTLAIYRKEENPESFFIAGLLHDVGRIILCSRVPEQVNQIFNTCRSQKELLYKVENDLLGFDHAELGGELLKGWNLPECQSEAVKYHHFPSQAPEYPLVAATVHLADIFTHTMRIGNSDGYFMPQLDHTVLKTLNIPIELIPEILTQIERQYSDFISDFLEY